MEIEHYNQPINLEINSPFPGYVKALGTKKYKVYNPDTDLIDVTISMLSGYVEIYVDSNEDVSREQFKDKYQMRKNLTVHQLIPISPVIKYDIKTAHDYYLLVKNTADVPASFIINVDKNNNSAPIIPGVMKLGRLAPGENKNYFYKPRAEEDLFEVQFELRNVFDDKFTKFALDSIGAYCDVYNISEYGDRFKLKYKEKNTHENRIYITFDISQNKRGTFTIHIYNPVGSSIMFGVNLLNGGYRLMNLNEHRIDFLAPK